MTWQEAKKHCEGDGAKLANVRNEWTRVYVELMAIKAPLWIGVNKMEVQGKLTQQTRLTLVCNLKHLLTPVNP